MREIKDLTGSYHGRCRVRDGMEDALAPAERKRFLKNTEVLPLELRADGTFHHKGTTEGTFAVKRSKIVLTPTKFNGLSESEMRQAAEDAGRTFGLGWLFAPFELVIRRQSLESGGGSALIFVEYRRQAEGS